LLTETIKPNISKVNYSGLTVGLHVWLVHQFFYICVCFNCIK